jgi:hypothetical protein
LARANVDAGRWFHAWAARRGGSRPTSATSSTRHPFRQADNQPDKPHKNRYERRKIKEFIRLGDWAGETPSLQT